MNLLRYFLLIILGLQCAASIAGLEPVLTSRKQGSSRLQVDSIVKVEDDKLSCLMTSSCSPSFVSTRLDGGVILGIDPDYDGCYSSFTVTVNLEVKYRDSSLAIQTENITLTLSYNPAAGFSTDDRNIYRIHNAYSIEAKIISFTSSLGGGVMPENVYLENILVKERWYAMSYTTAPSFNTMATPQADELTVSWNAIAGAEEYDLEWLYIDDFATWDGMAVAYYDPEDLAYDFTNDATRITTRSTSHTLKRTYEHGYLLFRVRPVNRAGSGFTQRMEGRWSSYSYGDAGFLDEFGSANEDYHQLDTGHEANLNWQWTAGFAEEGKSKTVISYFDGSLRSRQMVTHNSTEHFTIVGESFYDHVGRASVSALPAPTGQSVIHFYQDFNLAKSTGDPYSWHDFDTTNGVDICEATAAPMDTTSGASLYYSHANPDKNDFQAYVPDANFFPLVQTEFTPDMTGRVRRQGGVGPHHQLESGHETEYFYGSVASQEELSSLFGVEVGNYLHYKKNMVVDPNGQVSVSYIHPGGNVIATALAGKAPDNVIPLALDTAKRSLSSNLILVNRLESDGLSWLVNKTFTLSQPSPVDISYKFTDIEVAMNCDTLDICFSCSYDLTLRLEDDCGNLLMDQFVPQIKPFDTTCTEDSFDYDFSTTLGIGTYHLYKKLSLSEESFLEYEAVFLRNRSCVKSVEELYDSLVNMLDYSECYNTCESCLDSLGTFASFVSKRLVEDSQDTSGAVSGDSLIVIYGYEYEKYRENCLFLCDTIDHCEGLMTMMLQDVSPGGQYMTYSYDEFGAMQITDPLSFLADAMSVLHPVSPLEGDPRNWQALELVYKEPNGDFSFVPQEGGVRPNLLAYDEFVFNWRPSWAEELVKFHPEYCYYEFCLLNEEANSFDYDLMANSDYDLAEANLMFNPLKIDHPDAPGTYSSMSEDPFFATGGYGYDLRALIIEKCTTYEEEGSTDYSIWDMAVILTFCEDAGSETEMNDCLSDHSFGDGTEKEKNLQWEYFRAFYRGEREKLMDSARAMYANDSNCSNCLIGNNGEALYTTSCTTEYDDEAYTGKQKLFPGFNQALKVDLGDSPEDITDDALLNAHAVLEQECISRCEGYADYWMQKIDSCDFDASDSIAIRDSLIRICSLGCDEFNPFGASNVAPENESKVVSTTFGELLESFGIPNFRSKVCSEDLIEFPLPYGMDYTAGEFIMKPDICFHLIIDPLVDADCSQSVENLAMLNIINELIDLGKFAVTTEINLRAELSPGGDAWVDVLEPYFSVAVTETVYYVTHQDVNGDLVITFIADSSGIRDSCRFTIKLDAADKPYNYSDFTNLNGINPEYDACEGMFETHVAEATFIGINLDHLIYIHSECMAFCDQPDTFTAAERIQYTLQNEYCVTVSLGQAEVYVKMSCGDTTAREFIPAELSCNTPCITCFEIYGAKAAFSEKYGEVFDLESISLESDTNYTELFASFVNAHLMLNNTYEEYKELWENCDLFTDTNSMDEEDPALYLSTLDRYDIYRIAKGCYPAWDPLIDTAWQDTLVQYLVLCSHPLVSDVFTSDTISCDSLQREFAFQQAIYLHNERLEEARMEFRQNYYERCLAINGYEEFTLDYEIKEFHYTLYYYDQAGNLIKTVPPQGFHPITHPDTLALVDTNRKYGVAANYANTPHHTFVTNYRYNSLNEVRRQSTPDGGISEFFYDDLGRLVVSQNAKQRGTSANMDTLYSYTRYDALGRIVEVGEAHSPDAMTLSIASDDGLLGAWMMNCSDFRQVTFTVYEDTLEDVQVLSKFGGAGQENLRNRISHVYVYGDMVNDPTNGHLTAYSYDLHGNVKTMVQDFMPLTLGTDHYGVFKIDYDYDLVSGNVNQVKYQAGSNDQFFHKYEYDADNRIQSVYTSKDNLLWDEDARYFYYQHGPLARVEMGELKVQGTDYAYTIHGWLKGVNSATLDSTRDMGKDGMAGSNRYIPKDEFGFTLGYYQDDYQAITATDPRPKFTLYAADGSGWDNAAPSLFNGNIRHMTVAIAKFMEGSPTAKPIGYAYKYDQLNRIKEMNAYDSIDMPGNSWYVAAGALPYYHNRFTYDGNGNILTQVRRAGRTGPLYMDSLVYNYQTDNNKLAYVDDPVSAANYGTDIDDQSSGNYQYDAIGNLVSDAAEGIDSIRWNVYGKITHVYHSSSRGLPNLEFKYGPDGQRVIKRVFAAGTDSTISEEFYVRDAQGNIMAIYDISPATITKNVDSSYEKLIIRLIDEAGIDSFANFIRTQFGGDTTWRNFVEEYMVYDTSVISASDVTGCMGDYIYQYMLSCCDDCDVWGAQHIMDSVITKWEADFAMLSTGYLFDNLKYCDNEKIILAYLNTPTINQNILTSWGTTMNLFYGKPNALTDLYNFFRTKYGGTGTPANYLATKVDKGELLEYMKATWAPANFLTGFIVTSALEQAITAELDELADIVRATYSPCEFLRCIASCVGVSGASSYTGTPISGCSNAFTYDFEDRMFNFGPFDPGIDPDNYRGLPITSPGLSDAARERIVRCDPSSAFIVLYEQNLNVVNSFSSTFGGTVMNQIVAYFEYKYAYSGFGSVYSNAINYLKLDVPMEKLAEYLEEYFRLKGDLDDFEDFLWTQADAYNSTFDTMLSDYLPDCALINCLLPELNVDTRKPLDTLFFNPQDPFIFSQLFYCESDLYEGKVVQNITTRFSNNLIASAYPDYFENAVDRYPYAGLMLDLEAGANFRLYASCYPHEIVTGVFDLYPREFMSNLVTRLSLSTVLTKFGVTPGSGMDQTSAVLTLINRERLVDYLLGTYPVKVDSILMVLDASLSWQEGNEILFHSLTECQFKTCLKNNWNTITGSDTSEIYAFSRYNDWLSIAKAIFEEYPDSFNRAFSYLYPEYVGDILENWHYPLYVFMDGIESFYGPAMKDFLDGDTLVQTRFVRLNEFHLYGSSRLGILNQNDTLKRADLHYKLSLSDPEAESEMYLETLDYNHYAPDSVYKLVRGKKMYEGSNHLGNVLVAYSDKRLSTCASDTIYRYRADLRTANDYAAFGAILNDRQWYSTADSGVYRFGFHGMEKENERGGLGNGYTTEFRQYDARLGRWLSIDPLGSWAAGWTPYRSNFNNPFVFSDHSGLFETRYEDEGGKLIGETHDGIDITIEVPEEMEAEVRILIWEAKNGCEDCPDPEFVSRSPEWNKALTERIMKNGGFQVFKLPETRVLSKTLQIIPERRESVMREFQNDGDWAQSGENNVFLSAIPIALTAAAVDGPLPIGDAIGAVILAGATAYDASQRTFVTYTMTNAAGQIYIGRTSGYGDPYSIMMNRSYGHHMKPFGYGNPELDMAVQGYQGYPAIRGREQQLIDFHGGIASPNVGNAIRGVSVFNPAYPIYHGASNLYFGPLAPYTGF